MSALIPYGVKLKIKNRKKIGKFPNNWRLKNSLLNNTWLKEVISREIKNVFELNYNENTTYPKLYYTV